VSQPCTPACLVQASTLVTEGETAAWLDLPIPSLQATLIAAVVLPVDSGQAGHFRALLGAHQDLPPGTLAALVVVKGFERKW
jgi:hypothetical protein